MQALIKSVRFNGFAACSMSMLAAMAIATGLSQPAAAQLQQDPLTANPQSGDGSGELFGGNGSAGVSDMFDLMHQVQLGMDRSVADFNQTQQQSISTEAQLFRERQRSLLEQSQPPVTPQTGTIVPANEQTAPQ